MDALGLPAGIHVAQNDDGSWMVTGVADARAGVYDAEIRASDGELTAQTILRVTVQPEGATIGYTGDLLFSTGAASTSTAAVRMRAHVTQTEDGQPGDVTRAAVIFDLYSSTNLTQTPDASYRAAPAPDGEVVVDIASLTADNWTVVVRTDPDGGYFAAPASDAVVLTVYAPTPGSFVTGGGWVHDPGYLDLPVPVSTADDRGNLGLTVKIKRDGLPSGHVAYAFRGADGNDYLIRSTSWQGGGLAITGNRAVVAGRCAVTVVDSSGSVVSQSGNYTFRVDAVDAPTASQPDGYALSLFTPSGVLYHRVGTPAQPLALSGGNLVVHD